MQRKMLYGFATLMATVVIFQFISSSTFIELGTINAQMIQSNETYLLMKTESLDDCTYYEVHVITDLNRGNDVFSIDFDSDSDLDFIITDLIYPPTYPASYAPLKALRNDGNGNFVNVTDYVLGEILMVHPRHAAVADFNGDGLMDIFIADHGTDTSPHPGGQSKLLIQTSDGKLNDETNDRVPIQNAFTHHISADDIDNDGDIDVYMCNISSSSGIWPQLYMNDGTGNFTINTDRLPSIITNLEKKYTSSLFLDVDKDGDKDLVLGGHGGGVYPSSSFPRDAILQNNGSGYFTFAPEESMPLRYGDFYWGTVGMATGDFNNDQWPDLIMSTNYLYQRPMLQLLLNNQDGTFSDATSNIDQEWEFNPGNDSGWIAWVETADFNNDGWQDFTVRTCGVSQKIFFNMGDAEFVDAMEKIQLNPYSNYIGVKPGDFDLDGDIDFVFFGNYIYFVENFNLQEVNLTIVSGLGGTTDPSPWSYTYCEGTEVSITAIPESGYRFSAWTGNVPSGHENDNPITITMDSDKSITANFTAIPAEEDGGEEGEKKAPCFIATAAYGSPLHPHLDILRDFRDTYLLPSEVGRALVVLYYKYSPFVAELIAKNKVLKVTIQINLLPFVVFSYSMVHFGPIITAIMLILIFMVPIFLISLFRRRLKRA